MKCKLKNRDETIQQYIGGTLAQEEREAFDAHCFECDACFAALSMHERVAGIVKEEGDSLFPEVHSSRKKSGYRGISAFFDWLASIWIVPKYRVAVIACACLALLLVGRVVMDRPVSLPGLADKSSAPYIEMVMRDSDPVPRTFRTAMRAYGAEDYETAIVLLNGVIKEDAAYSSARFYLAVSLYMENRIEEAEVHLQQVLKDEPDRERGHWYMAQVFLLNADQANAEIMLKRVAELGQPVFSKKANKLLDKISSLK